MDKNAELFDKPGWWCMMDNRKRTFQILKRGKEDYADYMSASELDALEGVGWERLDDKENE